jgi:hypothetical protein
MTKHEAMLDERARTRVAPREGRGKNIAVRSFSKNFTTTRQCTIQKDSAGAIQPMMTFRRGKGPSAAAERRRERLRSREARVAAPKAASGARLRRYLLVGTHQKLNELESSRLV